MSYEIKRSARSHCGGIKDVVQPIIKKDDWSEAMGYKKLIAYINSENEYDFNIVKAARKYSDSGADEFYIYNYTTDEESKKEFFEVIKEIKSVLDIPYIVGLYAETLKDIEQIIEAGAERIVIKDTLAGEKEALILEAIARFGKDRFLVEIDSGGDFANWEVTAALKEKGFAGIVLKHTEDSLRLSENLKKSCLPVIIRDSLNRNILKNIIAYENVEGVATNYYRTKHMMRAKLRLKEDNIPVNVFEGSLSFSDFKTDEDGAIPVIVQDDTTKDVLIRYYINEEAYKKIIETGEMYYFNKKTRLVWHKGEKSGNYHYVKHLLIDNENGTILARVRPAGKGRSCFATELLEKVSDK